jgi:NAD(P)-dependent dehydrogenase (short-subunit alcohol dehydrogenase family)
MASFMGRTIMVTGASSGIGRAITTSLLQEGARVIAVSRDPSKLTDIPDGPGERLPVSLDLLDIGRYRETVVPLPPLDGVVHSAGVVHVRPLAFFSLDQYRQTVDTNLTAPLALTAELLRQRKLVTGASLVFLSSINGPRIGVKGCSAYAATKAGLVGAANVLALELAPQGIRVNCVLPGGVETPMTDSLAHVSDDSRRADLAAYPLGRRLARPHEVAAAIQFLLSDGASFMTGQSLVVDGGCSVQ